MKSSAINLPLSSVVALWLAMCGHARVGAAEPAPVGAVPAKPRPNILFVAIDDLNAWSNRGNAPMRVWLARDARTAWPAPAATLASRARMTSSTKVPWSRLDALNDQILPLNSSDKEVDRFVWKDDSVKTDADIATPDNPGGSAAQWVQYDLEKPAKISAIGIYWAEDQRGRVKLPESFRVLVKQGGEWKPVAAEMPKPQADAMNLIRFAPVETSSVRLEVSSPRKSNAAILEWSVE
ncbi:MAG: discoidin domain-containing protein [Verrucomicrobia bacterium]|nr:discoidin domain-containing protein [Verrucomicrobiota bacterium]